MCIFDSTDLDTFKEKVRGSRWLSKDEIETINQDENWKAHYPYLSRDAGADILTYIANSENGLSLVSSLDFAGDSLMCEYVYVIDLDTHKLDVYKGFNTTRLAPSERFFASKQHNPEYFPVRFWKSFPISKQVRLSENEFLNALDETEAELEDA